MRRLDKLLDSYEKRLLAMVLSVVILIVGACMRNYLLGNRLATFSNIQDIFSLVDDDLVYSTFVGQMLVNYLEYGNNAFLVIQHALGYDRIAILILMALFFFSKDTDAVVNTLKRLSILVALIIMAEYLGVGFLGYSVANAGNALQALSGLIAIGSLLRIFSIIIIIACIATALYGIASIYLNKPQSADSNESLHPQ